MKINSNEFAIVDTHSKEKTLYTTCLGDEIAFSFFIDSEKKGGLARNLNKDQIKKLFSEMNPESKIYKVELCVVGGDISQESIDYANMLRKILQELQKLGYNFEIEMKINGDLHPDFLFFNAETKNFQLP